MQIVNPREHVGCNVRIRPHGSSPHFGRGRLLGIEGQCGIVKPFQRHRKEERIPLDDIYSWAAGNTQPAGVSKMEGVGAEPDKDRAESPTQDLWVVADVDNVQFFVSTWAGFKPELNRAKLYDRLRSVNHAASVIRGRRTGLVGTIKVLTTVEAEALIRDRYHAEPTPAATPTAPPAVLTVDFLTKASPDDMRLASDILKRMADAEAMHREAAAELERVHTEWRQLQSRIKTDEPVEVKVTG